MENRYTKEQAIAKLSQIADNFNIKKLGSVAGLGRSGFQLRGNGLFAQIDLADGLC
jgi:hypothetical protein